MCYPNKREYLDKAINYNLIPVYKKYIVDTETPTTIFMKTSGLGKEMFLLESIEGAKRLSRYSFIGVNNKRTVKYGDGLFSLEENGETIIKNRSRFPLLELEKVIGEYKIYKDPELNHFVGGAVGYLGYDLVKYFDNINLPDSSLDTLEMLLFLTDTIIVFDHLLNTVKIIATVKINSDIRPEKTYDISIEKIKELEEKIFNNKVFLNKTGIDVSGNNIKEFNFNSNFAMYAFLDSVEKAKKYIVEGEVFQLVLSQRFESLNQKQPFDIYRALRILNPSPYMYYFNFRDFKIIGSSPEPLIKITGRKILTCPIAGTRGRGLSPKEDERLVNDLLNDEKEKAEHNMLVDLSRNDLGRICVYGSVKLKRYMKIEKYSHVIHMVSRVEGILQKDKTIYDALKSTFPAGTLTGAPKIRAMQLISKLEPDKRGLYGGIIGYFGYDGSLDSCITIRTALVKGDKTYVQAGAGIVYDSLPENEWKETVNKATALFKAISIKG
jgi:anthranilate synthase component 1